MGQNTLWTKCGIARLDLTPFRMDQPYFRFVEKGHR